MAEPKLSVVLKPEATGEVTIADGPFRKTFQPGVSVEVSALEYDMFIRPTGLFMIAPKTGQGVKKSKKEDKEE